MPSFGGSSSYDLSDTVAEPPVLERVGLGAYQALHELDAYIRPQLAALEKAQGLAPVPRLKLIREMQRLGAFVSAACYSAQEISSLEDQLSQSSLVSTS
jgi:hypothetical protein